MNTAENVPSGQHGFAMRLPGNGSIRVKRKLNSTEVIDALTDLFILRGVPAEIRSDKSPEFIAEAIREWIKAPTRQIAVQSPAGQWTPSCSALSPTGTRGQSSRWTEGQSCTNFKFGPLKWGCSAS